jgi:6-phosphogluconate dehydrogenase
MRLGMVGLGKMGGNMTRRLLRDGHEIVGYAPDPEDVAAVVKEGAEGATSVADIVSRLEPPRIVWTMVPAGNATSSVVEELASELSSGDLVIDGGNSNYKDGIARATALQEKGISFIDCGTSGGIWGLSEGYCLMIGAERSAFEMAEPIFKSLAPPNGYAHVGGPGTGHFVKMVHNGIEYAMMQGYGEGFDIMHSSDMDIDITQVAEVWRYGSVVRSWLLDLAADALKKDPALESVRGWVDDSGEARWTVQAAVENAVPAPAIALALFARFSSRQPDSFAAKLMAALRREFGGHEVQPAKE